jgi:hypothetical protein
MRSRPSPAPSTRPSPTTLPSTGSGGNQTSGRGHSISYTSYNQPASITQGAATINLFYDMDHQRMWRATSSGSWLYFDVFGVHSEIFISATTTWYDYIKVGGAMIAMRAQTGSTVTTRYLHTDNLGSISVLTDETGAVVERDGYDAWVAIMRR